MTVTPTIDRTKYLARINYYGEINDSVEVLTMLQHLHLLNVPFENLDIHLGRKIELSNNYEKIVTRGRGGFCYELNGLFFQLLENIGFDVKLISARVYNKDRGFGPEFDHMAIVASIGDMKYLVDVGFGEFACSPLKIDTGLLQADRGGNFMMKRYDGGYVCVGKVQEDDFVPEYIFTENSRNVGDFFEMCNYHQTSSESHFTQKRLCTILTDRGRTTISGNRLKKTEYGAISETELNENEFNKALWDYFKIRL